MFKTNTFYAVALSLLTTFDAPAHSQTKPLSADFFAALTKVKTHAQAAAVGKKFGFIQETDPERDNFFQNRKADATLQLLRNRIPSLYVSYRQDTYKAACDIAQALADANLRNPVTFTDPPYWPNQKRLVSGHKANVKGNDVFFGCEQFNPEGASSATVHMQLNP